MLGRFSKSQRQTFFLLENLCDSARNRESPLASFFAQTFDRQPRTNRQRSSENLGSRASEDSELLQVEVSSVRSRSTSSGILLCTPRRFLSAYLRFSYRVRLRL